MYIAESDSSPSFPMIKLSENASVLPRYTLVLSKSEDAVGMEDLDQLQQDLEKLLSTCAVRHRMLRSEIECIDKDKTTLKRKKCDDNMKYKDGKSGARILKKHHSVPLDEVSEVGLPKNDTADKFWLSIEPYCSNINKDDVAFLDELLQECSQEIDVKIPEVGEHYATEWSEEMLSQEQIGNGGRSRNKSISINNDIKKNVVLDTFSSPLTQRLLAALIEEKVMVKFPTITDKLKASDLNVLKSSSGPRAGVCMDRRLRKELVEQGISDVEDLPKSMPTEDEIYLEIKKCQQELATVNKHNVEELNRLRTIIAKDLRRQEVEEALEIVDNQVMELYNKILLTKKRLQDDSDELCVKPTLPKQVLMEFEAEGNNIITQQIILHREITELTDFSIM